MITRKLVKRFNQYRWQNNNHNKKNLKKYINDYFKIVKKNPDVSVPSIFVMKQIESNYHITTAAWTMNVPTVFPPTDFIAFLLCDDINQKKFRQLGWSDPKSLLEVLSPHLVEVDSYDFLKKLKYDYEYTEEIEQLVKTVAKPMPIPRFEIIGVDMIPSFKEQMIYYKNMHCSGINEGRQEALSRLLSEK